MLSWCSGARDGCKTHLFSTLLITSDILCYAQARLVFGFARMLPPFYCQLCLDKLVLVRLSVP